MASAATENSFRSSLSQFRWARGVTDDSQARDDGNSRNPFSRFYSAIGGAYIPLRSSENSNEEEAYFALPVGKGETPLSLSSIHVINRARRLLGFLACLAGAAVCFGVAFLTLPLLAIRPAKFALSFRYVHNFARALHC